MSNIEGDARPGSWAPLWSRVVLVIGAYLAAALLTYALTTSPASWGLADLTASAMFMLVMFPNGFVAYWMAIFGDRPILEYIIWAHGALYVALGAWAVAARGRNAFLKIYLVFLALLAANVGGCAMMVKP